jgi:periplasmic divalent cation tolerance protein
VQILPIRSVYRWEGRLCREPEFLLLIKTRAARFDAIAAFIRERHGYTTPEIIQLPIANGSEGYLRWLDGNSGG